MCAASLTTVATLRTTHLEARHEHADTTAPRVELQDEAHEPARTCWRQRKNLVTDPRLLLLA